MGLKEVKDDILQEAEEEADRITSEAESKAEEIRGEAEQEAERIIEEAEQEIEDRKKSIEKQQLSNARMKAREKKLEAKQRAIDDVFDSFRDDLEDMTGDEKEEFVSSCLEKAEFEVGSVKASEGFEDAVESEGFEPESFEKTGILVVSEDGNRKQEFSFERIIENLKSEHRKDVSEVLF